MKLNLKQPMSLALLASLVLHAALYAWLHGSYHVPHLMTSRQGVVSVDFVQSFSHETASAVGKGQERAKSKAAQEQPSAPNLVGQKGVEGDPAAIARESDIFIGKITALIASHKIYPQEAIDREEEGKVVLGLTVERDGLISSVQIEQPSHFELLNQAAMRAVHSVERFPPVPEQVPVPLHLHVPLVFRIETR